VWPEQESKKKKLL